MTVLLSLNAQRSGRVWFMLTCPTSITEIGISLNLMKRMTGEHDVFFFIRCRLLT